MVGQPVPILIDGKFYIERLHDIFNREDVCDLPACILAVAGPMRTGKSFLLCYLLRYLKEAGCHGWMGGENEPLSGFHHEQSEDGVTKGITIWSEPFIVNTPTGKVAVYLVDSQGAFDSTSSGGEENFIFALTQQLSSVMVYNVMSRINENDLNNFLVFSSYAKCQELSFQKLVFLVRDWNSPLMYNYGSSGGESLCYDKLLANDTQSERSQEIRQYLWNSFDEIKCFLMPDPGTNVREKEGFDGRLADLRDSFKTCLKEFAEQLLSSNNLVIKKMNTREVTSGQLYKHIKEYAEESYKNMSPFENGTMLQMNVEYRSSNNVKLAHEEFINKMELVKADVQKVIQSKEVMGLFSEIKEDVTSAISDIKTILGNRLNSTTVIQLLSSIAREIDNGIFNLMRRGQKDGINGIVNEISSAIQRILMGATEVGVIVQQVETRVIVMLVSIIEKIFKGLNGWFRPQFNLWMNLHERIEHAVSETFMIFDNGNRYASINGPEVAEEKRKEFEKLIQGSRNNYIKTFEQMGLKFWASSVVFGCVFGGLLGAVTIVACAGTGGAALGVAAGTAIKAAAQLAAAGAATSAASGTAGVGGGAVALMGAEAVSAMSAGAAAEAGAAVAGIGTKAIFGGALLGGAAVGSIVAAGGLVYYLMKKHVKKPPNGPMYEHPQDLEAIDYDQPSMCERTVEVEDIEMDVDEENTEVEHLIAMGYDEIKVRVALSASDNNIEMALQFLQWEEPQGNSCDEANFVSNCNENLANTVSNDFHGSAENPIVLNDSLGERDVIERLQNLVNISEDEARKAYFACGMDEKMAAELLILQYIE